MHTEISSDTHYSVNNDDNYNIYDINDEDPRPAKRRKSRSAPAATPTDHGCTSTLVDNGHRHGSRASRSPSVATEAVLFTEYQEWPFQGFFKRTKIGDNVTYNLEFKLLSIWGHLYLPINPEVLDINHDAATYSKIHQAPL
jgi:hypothetical protein